MIDLKPFCSTAEIRPDLLDPWSHGEYTYATNGFIAVRVPRRPDAADKSSEGESCAGTVDSYLTGVETADMAPLPDVEPPAVPAYVPTPCMPCAGTGREHVTQCRDCRGAGMHECQTCHHEDECETCHGSGQIVRAATTEDDPKQVVDCDECGGTGDTGDHDHRPIVYTRVGPYWVDRYLVVLMQSLPGMVIDLAVTQWHAPPESVTAWRKATPIQFRFDGGVGCVMPLRPERTAEATACEVEV